MTKHTNTGCILSKFYIKPQQTTLENGLARSCILSKFYIKPQLEVFTIFRGGCCILSKFYIKPQHYKKQHLVVFVVSYRNSTSNHNALVLRHAGHAVVSYRNSTSNHNSAPSRVLFGMVVSYRNSTSNHNADGIHDDVRTLYLIEILHQTTTQR